MEGSDNFLVMNSLGMVVDKSESFPKNLAGDIMDILSKGRGLLKGDSLPTTIDLVFENSSLVIMDNEKGSNAIATLVDQKKK